LAPPLEAGANQGMENWAAIYCVAVCNAQPYNPQLKPCEKSGIEAKLMFLSHHQTFDQNYHSTYVQKQGMARLLTLNTHTLSHVCTQRHIHIHMYIG